MKPGILTIGPLPTTSGPLPCRKGAVKGPAAIGAGEDTLPEPQGQRGYQQAAVRLTSRPLRSQGSHASTCPGPAGHRVPRRPRRLPGWNRGGGTDMGGLACRVIPKCRGPARWPCGCCLDGRGGKCLVSCHVCPTLTPAGTFLVTKSRALDGRVTSVWPPCHSQQPGSVRIKPLLTLNSFGFFFSSTLHP